MSGVKYRRESSHVGRWELFFSTKGTALPQEQTERNLVQKCGKKLLTISEILKHLSNRTKHVSEKCNEHVEMTALYLEYLWEAITWCVLNRSLIRTKNPPVCEFCIRVKPRFMSFFISVTFGIFIKAEIKRDQVITEQ